MPHPSDRKDTVTLCLRFAWRMVCSSLLLLLLSLTPVSCWGVCCCAVQASLLCVSVTGKQGNRVGMWESVRAEWVFVPLCLPCCFLVGWCVSSPPQYPWGSLPVSQLLPAISVAAMPLHCEDTCPGSLLVPLVNTGGEEGRDGSSWLHWPLTLERKEGSEWGEWILYPSIIVFSLPSLNLSFLISETLDKLTLVTEREGELEGKGVAGGAQIQHQERRTDSNAIHWHFKVLGTTGKNGLRRDLKYPKTKNLNHCFFLPVRMMMQCHPGGGPAALLSLGSTWTYCWCCSWSGSRTPCFGKRMRGLAKN